MRRVRDVRLVLVGYRPLVEVGVWRTEEHGEVQLESHFGACGGPSRGRGAVGEARRALERATGARHAADDAEGSASYVVSVGPRARSAGPSGAARGDRRLVQSQGGRVVGQEICHLSEPNPRTLLGKGTAQEMAARARSCGATMLVLDAELSPSQTRNLEDTAGIPICDREAIILNVFLRHARTRRARIQVEIAQLEYLRPRIRGVGLDMDQQAGGMARARGPGETASELLARKLDGRLEELQKALRKLETSGRTQRRQRGACKRMVLVGYTNAGKTSLMNALTAAGLSARDMPFETLDTTSRCLTRHGGDVLISDTVGFIRRLPERLLASFESTLAEISRGVAPRRSWWTPPTTRGSSSCRRRWSSSRRWARRTSRGSTCSTSWTASRRLPDEDELARWSEGHPWAVLSTRDARAVADLEEALLRAVRREEEELTTFVPYAATRGPGARLRQVPRARQRRDRATG